MLLYYDLQILKPHDYEKTGSWPLVVIVHLVVQMQKWLHEEEEY